jgi:hypothetical protein
VRIVSFWCNNATLVVDDMYLTNNDDYSREDPTGLNEIDNEELQMTNDGAVYDLSGRRVNMDLNSSLKKGIYIVNGKKILK